MAGNFDCDLFVIGGGSGGVRAARIAAGYGARVMLAEERYLGGTCVNVGCIPKKLYRYGAEFADALEDAKGYGWQVGEARHDWATMRANKDKEIARLNDVYSRLLQGPGVEILKGRARITGPNEVEVAGRRITAERILIATGGRPWLPDDPGVKDHALTSDDFFALKALPKRVVVAGGGYIAVELAGIFHALGCELCLVYRGELFLRGFDFDVRESLAEEMARAGVDMRFRTIISRIDKTGDDLTVWFSDGSFVATDAVLFAVGRRPNTADLGLEELGIEMDEMGAVKVDEAYTTNVPSIFAVGDVTDRVNLTPVALAEGHWLADRWFGAERPPIDYRYIPSAVFSEPEIASVGLSEEAARALHDEIRVYRAKFRPLKHTMTGRQVQMMMKLVVDAGSDRVLGCHMVGEGAAEIMQGLAVAVTAGAKKSDFDRTLGIHPTAAEEFVTMRQPLR